MEIYQWIYLILLILNLGCALALHGQPKTGKWNFWGQLIGTGINFYLLTAGGFFRW